MTPQPSEQPRTRFYRTRVLSLLRHDSECTDGQWCVCKAGQALMDLIAAERAEAAASAPVATPADRSLIRAAISNADRKVRTWATQQELRQMTPAERTEYVRVRTALAIAALPQDKRDALSIDSDAAIEAEATAPDPVASPLDGDRTMQIHALDCRCYPHVSERDAIEAMVKVARAEYLSGSARSAAPIATPVPAQIERAVMAEVGPWFDEVYENGRLAPMVLAQRIIRRLGAVASPAPLDVALLARAIEFVGWRNPRLRANRHEVLMIAAEYERLEGQPVAEEGT